MFKLRHGNGGILIGSPKADIFYFTLRPAGCVRDKFYKIFDSNLMEESFKGMKLCASTDTALLNTLAPGERSSMLYERASSEILLKI